MPKHHRRGSSSRAEYEHSRFQYPDHSNAVAGRRLSAA
ncbi:hypothetical protein DIQ79_04545 [Mycolicibacterium smegmatis]|uniref:Uncharacterized protein n=1 Tax=Mycolicibacterium smegmatis (strain ATCC 700084 / mc(2)155) TaxID=246196 RepID=A0R011_MYCS2|nr:hypothetical protein MSMEG_4223 [Mycolicibacterium smegmatis MC2 155]TBM45229.1 hypothetical protein DIQ86_15260 [Mycolicibacterium smegmatis]TBH51342.1 hypothetical protein EYS45_03060 [Mycolicibacterium smegmatis MC2 155]TBM54811.1 hypothetical protein DIQ85_05095 [Mycolicibacterium smegmatis]TBM66236.1 hypothetical protein DIQ83_05115 [Mycolicibacterium smegmatis]